MTPPEYRMTTATKTPAATETPPAATAESRKKARRVAMTTASLATFSLTLLACGMGLAGGLIPMPEATSMQRLDAGALLIVAPIVALILAMMVEVTRIALRSAPLPDPRPARPTLHWQPVRRER
jgi:hypothetical protein